MHRLQTFFFNRLSSAVDKLGQVKLAISKLEKED